MRQRFLIFTAMLVYVAMVFMLHTQLEVHRWNTSTDKRDNADLHFRKVNHDSKEHFKINAQLHYENGKVLTLVKQNETSVAAAATVNVGYAKMKLRKTLVGEEYLPENQPCKENCTNSVGKEPAISDFKNVSGIYVFSAFYDDRNESQKIVRIITLQKRREDRSLVCWFHLKESFVRSETEKYELCENHGKTFEGWIYSCRIPQNLLHHPKRVLLSISESQFWSSHVKLELIPVDNQQRKMPFGVCVPPLFGSISLSKLVQFLELSKILGASHFNFYNHSPSLSINSILKYYSDRGDVSVVKWELPQVVGDNIWYHGQLLAIQDCLYRNMARFQYLVFTDLDEFIIPRTARTWMAMIQSITKNATKDSSLVGFSFKSSFFNPFQMPERSQTLGYMQLLRRTRAISSVRTKVMVRPEQVFELGIHHISRTLREGSTIVKVDPADAIIHHYRPCIVKYEPTLNCFPTLQDDSILKYAKQLQKNYNSRVHDLLRSFKNLFRSIP